MSTSSLRRQMKNIVHNYSEAEIKVREATSNDPWGPSSSLMSEIADLTYNVVAFSEIMSMIWKRLNDHGKNWRHVYKAMTLMEYLIKTGSERVAQQCKENIYAIQTLKDFQYVDRDGKDQGVNVREKAKQLVALLKDDERLREERAHALKTKEKLAQTSTSSSASSTANPGPDAEQAWPQSTGEEELQLQLALAMSKEEAEQEERIRRGDDLRLQMAIEESRKEVVVPGKQEESSLMDLADVFPAPPAVATSDPWGASVPPPSTDPWAAVVPASTLPVAADPWGCPPVSSTASSDPWGSGAKPSPAPSDPWGGTPAAPEPDVTSDPWNPAGGGGVRGAPAGDPWASSPESAPQGKASTDPWSPAPSFSDPWGGSPSKPSTNGTTGELDLLAGEVPVIRPPGTNSPDSFEMASMSGSLPDTSKPTRKTPESFLGPNAALVDLDSLVSKPGSASAQNIKTSNPFLATGGSTSSTTNPFQSSQQPTLTLNQLRASPVMSMGQPVTPAGAPATAPIAAPFGSASPLVSVSPMAPGMPLASVSPMQPMGSMPPMQGTAQGVSAVGMPVVPPQLVQQSLIPSNSLAPASTNPFLL
ncbi:epsin-1 isoform X4 [Microcaecilia unicolor]|uniref:Epsin-1 isoform X4 n=1 Tax=Microcaecilia unicolor TaxID=1415580 RepID=A0A6P7XLZ0_9AMPH|nr:epsin-1 isoform X4 [Microcaecilia unicolor]